MTTDEMVELRNLRWENRELRKRLDAANRIICEQVADAARFVSEYYVRKYESYEEGPR